MKLTKRQKQLISTIVRDKVTDLNDSLCDWDAGYVKKLIKEYQEIAKLVDEKD